VPRVSADFLQARRAQILDGARVCFARYGYEGATVRRLEQATGLSRGAIFHHFGDKESLFLALAEQDASQMAAVVAENGLVQVMRDLLEQAEPGSQRPDRIDWLGTRLEVSRRLRTDTDFRASWVDHSAELAGATRRRLTRMREAGSVRCDVQVEVLAGFLELVFDGLVAQLAMGRPAGELDAVLDVVESTVRRDGAG
jgi:TetR/AcrR family transcriptional regulator, transcriptional repressor of aconitase